MQSSTPTPTSGISYLTQQDKLVNYASVFIYNPKLRSEFKDYAPSLTSYESKGSPKLTRVA
jgi:hypothetical protein